MVCTVRDDVHEHLPSRHCSSIAVGEAEADALAQLVLGCSAGVALVPGVSLGY